MQIQVSEQIESQGQRFVVVDVRYSAAFPLGLGFLAFGFPPFKGSIRISALSPASIVGLRGRYNERGDFLVTTFPALGSVPNDTGEVVFPHFADGAGYTTQFILIGRPSSLFASGVLTLFAQTGDPMPLTLN